MSKHNSTSKERSLYTIMIAAAILSIFVSICALWFVTNNTENRLIALSHNLEELESQFRSLEKSIRTQSSNLTKNQKSLESRILKLEMPLK